jgi:hypothetical protein
LCVKGARREYITNVHHGGTETQRKAKSKAKPELTEAAEAGLRFSPVSLSGGRVEKESDPLKSPTVSSAV